MKINSTYFGNQKKYLSSNGTIWTKKDFIGGEAIAEVLVSEFLESCVNHNQFEGGFVRYGLDSNNRHICHSKNFLSKGEMYIPISKAVESLNLQKQEFSNFEEKFNFINDVTSHVLGASCKSWLVRLLTLDVMFRNTDRHLSNFGFIMDIQGNIRLAPIFDNGLALGVSEGAYYDVSNAISGLGFSIKPYEMTVRGLAKYIDVGMFQFSVNRFIQVHDKNISKSNLLLVFLNILVRYYPKDYYGKDTKAVLEGYFGLFNKRKFLV